MRLFNFYGILKYGISLIFCIKLQQLKGFGLPQLFHFETGRCGEGGWEDWKCTFKSPWG